MRAYAILVPFFALLIGGSIWLKTHRDPDWYESDPARQKGTALDATAAFLAMQDPETRARAIFTELSKVFTHARCANCHTLAAPLQGDSGQPHQPMVVRANGGAGAPGMLCVTCHGTESFQNVPGAPGWILAPEELAWAGRGAAEICADLKAERPALDDVADYLRENPMVDHGWSRPRHLEAAPGSKASLVTLFDLWIDSGAHCPDA